MGKEIKGKTLTKKEKIIQLINKAVDSGMADGSKIITKEMFQNADLCGSVEYGEKWNDVFYTVRIAKTLGFRALIGGVLLLLPVKTPDTTKQQ